MARPRSNTKVVCQNKMCRFFHKRDDKDIIKKGINSAGHRQYLCLHCKTYFVETKNTPLFNRKLSERQIITICKHLVEKNGIRSIERITGHHRDTIGNLMTSIAEHAKAMNEYLIKELKLSPIEADEFWTFVKKSKRRLTIKAQIGLKLVVHTDTHL